MELKIGDYIRTEYGINKIAEIDENKTKYKYLCLAKSQDDDGTFIYINFKQEDIIKSSPNIIDLIEKNDYVNGSKVMDNNYCYIIYDDDFEFGETKMKGSLLLENQVIIDCGFEIKSICTKENFERSLYYVKNN